MANKLKDRLLLRAETFKKIRAFFAKQKVIEVETPLLLPATNPAPYLENFNCDGMYLQTSPEFAMKRLLADGSGDIYQICKAFRKSELGRLHNPEFTMLEWYRINFDHHNLMDEMDQFLMDVAKFPQAKRYTYKNIFEEYLSIDPLSINTDHLQKIAKDHQLIVANLDDNKDSWLQLIFAHLIEPNIGKEEPIFVYDFPKTQAMLAKIRDEDQLASRFEVYYQGVELANGFHELTDAKEQQNRFENDLKIRKQLNLPPIPIDEEFLTALPKIPNCAGVALGIDRLLLLIAATDSLDNILCFRDNLSPAC